MDRGGRAARGPGHRGATAQVKRKTVTKMKTKYCQIEATVTDRHESPVVAHRWRSPKINEDNLDGLDEALQQVQRLIAYVGCDASRHITWRTVKADREAEPSRTG